MKKIIHQYLTYNYLIKCGNLQNINGNYVPKNELVNELIKIFGITEKDIKWYIKSWSIKQRKNFDFKNFWGGNLFFLPIVNRRFGRLLATDLVRVEPIGGPSGILHYVDYQYSGSSIINQGYVFAPYIPVINGPQVINEPQVIHGYANTPINPNFYCEININQPIGLSSRARADLVSRWENSGYLNNLTGNYSGDTTIYEANPIQVVCDPQTGHINLPYNQIMVQQDFYL